MRDIRNKLSAASAIAAAVYTAGAQSTIDRMGFDSLAFVLAIGAGGITFTGTNRVDFILEDSDDGTTFSPVDATNVEGAVPDQNGIVLSLTAAKPAASVTSIGYIDGVNGSRRYVRLRPVFGGTHATGTPISAIALLGGARVAPVS